jgi:hypothetical protein
MGDVYCIMSFYISFKPTYQANGSVAQKKRAAGDGTALTSKPLAFGGMGAVASSTNVNEQVFNSFLQLPLGH